MKTLYLECAMGAAGDMLTAALLELVEDRQAILDKMNSLGLPGVRVSAEPAIKCGITGTHMKVTVNGEEEESLDVQDHPEHPHEHDHHHDHDAVENLKGEPRIIDKAGQYTPEPDVRVTAVKGFHDDEQGSKRGETLLFLIETEGLRIVHLGDLGCALDNNQLEQLKKPDILMIPIGGFYTIGAEQAKQTAEQLGAGIILPMHYRTEYNQDWPISGPEAVLEQFATNEICQGAEAVRVTKADMMCQPRIIMFSTGR